MFRPVSGVTDRVVIALTASGTNERMATVVRLAGILAVTMLLAGCSGGGAASTPDPQSEDDKAIYTMGYLMGKRAQQSGLSPEEATIAARGFYDAAIGKDGAVKPEEYGQKITAFSAKRMTER